MVNHLDLFPFFAVKRYDMVRPKKRLGQHFLTDHNIAQKIVNSLEANSYSTVVEVGPGKGILTGYLLQNMNLNLIPVEIDDEASDYLLDNWPGLADKLIRGDFLAFDLESFDEKYGIIGNFPYNISSRIFFRILENRDRVEEVVCMVQKEVADRIISHSGNKTYGILSVLLQTWYDVSCLFTVNPGSFFPAPKVRSSVIRLVRNRRTAIDCGDDFYKKLVKTSFNQRRKMLRNSISDLIYGIDIDGSVLTMRPEQLGVDDFIKLADQIFSQKSNLIKHNRNEI